jgi:hypothetical protein
MRELMRSGLIFVRDTVKKKERRAERRGKKNASILG